MAQPQTLDLKIKEEKEIVLKAGRRQVKCDPGDEIVISGFSGSFPNSDGLPNFAENLFNKVDLTSDDDRRWTMGRNDLILFCYNYSFIGNCCFFLFKNTLKFQNELAN